MAGSNAIKYYSPAIFKSVGLAGRNTAFFATGVYGVVRIVSVLFAMVFVVDRFGRTMTLMAGSFVMVTMWYIGAYVILSSPGSAGSSSVSSADYAGIAMIYVVPYMITNIGCGTYFLFAALITVSIPWVFFCAPETKGVSLEDVDALFGLPQIKQLYYENQNTPKDPECNVAHAEHSRRV
ncbi:hypothetical protein J3459_014924 [Metarhizium acridum]|uniref:uncharacterized protein n=1 Tax=Metarhizium acridum TaxID=92637 RepID=UPI001C6C4940|nr:hypothetical protein J3458_011620 [Metarhizium acridum]KAG8414197.1 hypothetical protein J3459_014924 [Metarhizium acridum]